MNERTNERRTNRQTMNEVLPYYCRSHHVYSKSGSQPLSNWCLHSQHVLSCFHLSPALATLCGSWAQGGDSQWSSYTPQRTRQRALHLGSQAVEAVAGVEQAVTHPGKHVCSTGPNGFGESLPFLTQWSRSYHKYFLQLTFLATLKLSQRVT